MIRWNIEKVKEYVEENSDTLLLSDEYTGRDGILKFKCKCGEIFTRSWRVFYRGSHYCKRCSWELANSDKRYTLEYVKQYVKDNSNSELISECYNSCKELLEFKCSCGEMFTTTFDAFKNSKKTTCNSCSMPDGIIGKDGKLRPSISNRKNNTDFLRELKEARGDEYIALEEYISAKTPINVRHKVCGYVWNVSPDHLINRKDCCPSCSDNPNNSRGNNKIEDILNSLNLKYTKEKTFKGLYSAKGKRLLRFDFYIPKLNLCIEYDGEQHFKPIPIFGGEEGYKLQIMNDELKNRYCSSNKIRLLRIPFYRFNEIEHILNKAIMSQVMEIE